MKYGHYTIGEKTTSNALMAFITGSHDKIFPKWHFHDEVFSKVDLNAIPERPLSHVYAERAAQLRDMYDYLILQYSGGSDSHCILNTFLNYGIRLDEVVIKFPFEYMDKFHSANDTDRSASNYLSEWEYTIKPDLERLKRDSPYTKITKIDWLKGVTADTFNDEWFETPHGMYFMSHMLKHPQRTNIESERKLLDQGKRVGVINGVEKPYLLAKGGKVYLTFPDKPMQLISPTLDNPNGTEYFFWTPDMPNIAFEQARKVFYWFNQNRQYQKLLYQPQWIGRYTERWEKYSELVKPIIYPNWDITRFQVNKPVIGKHWDMSEYEENIETLLPVQEIKQGWRHFYYSYRRLLDNKNMTLSNGHLPSVNSSYYYIGTFE